MSGLTVKTCFETFPQMEAKDMAKLLGTTLYTDNTPIMAYQVAQYNGNCADAISVFFAKNNKNEFIPLLNDNKRTSIMAKAGIEPQEVPGLNKENNNNNQQFAKTGSITMNTSIFDIYRKKQFA